jgi:DNA-binding transcriptional regulator YiaG
MMYCFNCYAFQLNEIVVDDYIYSECYLPNIVLKKIKLRVCPYCHAVSAAIDNRTDLHQTIAVELVNKRRKLTSKEISFLLKLSGYHELDIAPMMNCRVSTVKNWEIGHAEMSETQEKFFRFLMANKLKKKNCITKGTILSKDSSRLIFLYMNERGEWNVSRKVHH